MNANSLWSTVLLLIFTLIVVPISAYFSDVALTDTQIIILKPLLGTYLAMALLCFVVSTLTHNVSQVDKLWSIMPIVYAWIMAIMSQYEPRIVLMAVLVSLWGIRLTYNFSRRGGYSWRFWSGEEDYRWEVLRQRPEFRAPWKWMLFNLFFISLYQMGLILLMTLPMLKSIGGIPLGPFDYVLVLVFLLFLLIETLADRQQWDFQQEKYRRLDAGVALDGEYARGFLKSGLWGMVRHPNYGAEQAIWLTLYGFSILASGNWLNWSIVGALLLMILFRNSSDFSEDISATKYPAYRAYQDDVPRFFPRFWR